MLRADLVKILEYRPAEIPGRQQCFIPKEISMASTTKLFFAFFCFVFSASNAFAEKASTPYLLKQTMQDFFDATPDYQGRLGMPIVFIFDPNGVMIAADANGLNKMLERKGLPTPGLAEKLSSNIRTLSFFKTKLVMLGNASKITVSQDGAQNKALEIHTVKSLDDINQAKEEYLVVLAAPSAFELFCEPCKTGQDKMQAYFASLKLKAKVVRLEMTAQVD
jgi:hypothetical protein